MEFPGLQSGLFVSDQLVLLFPGAALLLGTSDQARGSLLSWSQLGALPGIEEGFWSMNSSREEHSLPWLGGMCLYELD